MPLIIRPKIKQTKKINQRNEKHKSPELNPLILDDKNTILDNQQYKINIPDNLNDLIGIPDDWNNFPLNDISNIYQQRNDLLSLFKIESWKAFNVSYNQCGKFNKLENETHIILKQAYQTNKKLEKLLRELSEPYFETFTMESYLRWAQSHYPEQNWEITLHCLEIGIEKKHKLVDYVREYEEIIVGEIPIQNIHFSISSFSLYSPRYELHKKTYPKATTCTYIPHMPVFRPPMDERLKKWMVQNSENN